MTRRAAAAAAALFMLLTACPSRTQPPDDAGAPPADTPPRGELKVAYPWEPPTLNPFVRGGDSVATRELVRPLMPSLFRLLPDGESQPWLFDRVLSEQPTLVRLRLRRDARWSDGRPIGVSDFVFTWNAIRNRALPIASREGYDRIAEITEPQPRVLQMRFAQPFARWRDLFSAGLGVLPAHRLQGVNVAESLRREWPVSGGPYVLARYIDGLEMVLEASPHPWRARPRFERIRIQFVPDPTTALQLYRGGRVDVLGPYSSPDFARRAAAEKAARLSRDTGATWVGLVLDTTDPILADARVRRAIALGADRAGIVGTLVRDEGKPLTTPFARPAVEASDPAPHDPPTAATLLDATGFVEQGGVRRRGGRELAVSVASASSDELAARVARALFTQLRRAGFSLSIVELEHRDLWTAWLPSERLQAAIIRFADPPGGALRARYGASQAHPAGVNYSRVRSAVADGSDDASAVARELSQTLPVIPLYRATVTVVARDDLRGVRANASADGMFATIDEWRRAA